VYFVVFMSDKKDFAILILAAGMGTRMKSELPKVLHSACGRPLVGWLMRLAQQCGPDAIGVVVGHKAEVVGVAVRDGLTPWGITAPVEIIVQRELTGSGRCVQESMDFISGFSRVMVLCGDAPLVTADTLRNLSDAFTKSSAKAAVLTTNVPNPTGYGRIVRRDGGLIDRIVEETDADDAVRAVTEINSGMYMFDTSALAEVIGQLKAKPPKNEFYLTDVIELFNAKGYACVPCAAPDWREVLGINSRVQLAEAEAILRRRICERLMLSGVTIEDPDTVYIDDTVEFEPDTVVRPGSHIKGRTRVGTGSSLGPNCFVKDCVIGRNCDIKFGSYLSESVFDESCSVGPYSHIRPKCDIGPGVKIGNFTECKAVKAGRGSKIPHLTYAGDAEIGEGVNVGAGTITCNYDGVKKHRTVIGDRAFIGSNVNLVAPVAVGPGAVIGAGSTITEDVPERSLAIARSRQVVKPLRK